MLDGFNHEYLITISSRLCRNNSTNGRIALDRLQRLFMLIEWIQIESLPRLGLCERVELRRTSRVVDEMM